jgi:phosphoribosylformimino-5-aminoimidazole carboxamide ribotide isomerase
MSDSTNGIQIIPAIDLMDGKCVRLKQGKKDSRVIYSDDPVEIARQWENAGARWLHIVDLDGAFSGEPKNEVTIQKIRQAVSMEIEVGGGIRTPDIISRYIDLGMNYVILGTRAYKDQEWLKQQITDFGSRIIVGVDAKEGLVTSHGWTVTEKITASSFALNLEEMGIKTIIYTDVLRDGMLTGPNLDALSAIAQTIKFNVIASGGIHTIKDIIRIKNLNISNITGIITGKALYEKTLDIKEAISVLKE